MTGGARLCAPVQGSAVACPTSIQAPGEHRGQHGGIHVEADAGVGFRRIPVGHRLALGEFAVGFGLHDGGTAVKRPGLTA